MKISNRPLPSRQAGKNSEKATELQPSSQSPKSRSSEKQDLVRGDRFQRSGPVNPFGQLMGPAPSKPRTQTPFSVSVEAVRGFLDDPSPTQEATLRTSMEELSSINGGVNIHELVFSVMKEAIEETNEDKKYFLEKLQMFNSMGEQLSDYLDGLVEAAQGLGTRRAEPTDPD